jgi:hypothetical protein
MKLRILFFSFLAVAVAGAPAFCQSSETTSSLSCWDTHHGGSFQTRHARTQVAKSSGGSAYAEVTAEASNSGEAQFCKNTVQVFFAKDGTNYKVAYEKAGLDDEGVGIRVLGWSQNGKKLLMETSVWGYDLDHDVSKSALLLEADTAQVKELPLADAFEHVFGKDCEFDSSVLGWQGDERVLIRVGKTPPTTKYQQTFCVEKPTIYSFNLIEGKIQTGKP